MGRRFSNLRERSKFTISNTKLSICAYGESARGKSSLGRKLIEAVRLIHPGAKAKIYTTEHSAAYQSEVSKGNALIWNLNTRETPFETIDFAAKGGWPVNVDDPKSPINITTKEDLLEFPIRIYEGLSTFSDFMGGGYVSGGLAARSGRGDRIGPAEETIKFVDGSISVGGNPRSHYNVVQTYIRGAVANSHKLPVYLLWTAHEEKAKEDRTGLPIVGPEVFGQKATQHVPRWFANVLHLSMNPLTKNTKDGPVIEPEYYMWLKPHYDPLSPGIPFIAKNSIDIEHQSKVPTFLKGGALALDEFIGLLKQFGQL